MAQLDGYKPYLDQEMQNASVTATGWSSYVDLQGVHGTSVLVSSLMTTADASNYLTPVLYEAADGSTATDSASYTAVASADIYAESLSARNDTAGVTERIGYRGDKRYLAVKWTETGTAEGTVLVVLLGSVLTHKPGHETTLTTGTIT